MYVINGIAYAGKPDQPIKVKNIKVLDHLYLLITFTTGEMRVYDASVLLNYPVYKPLAERDFFKQAYVESGTVVWDNGNIDISPKTLYANSYEYTKDTTAI